MSDQSYNPGAGNSSDGINKAAQTAHETIDRVAVAADAARDSTSKAYVNLEESLRSYTRERPISSLLWALGIGFVLGRLVR